MASLLLPAGAELLAAASFVGPIAAGQTFASTGALIATQVAGGLLDSLFIFPRIFSQPATEGPRIGELGIQENSEGSPENRVYGDAVPVPGILVWATRLREVEDSSSGGGKGGTGGTFLQFKYFVHMGVQFARSQTTEVLKVWADGKDFVDSQPDFDEESDQIAAEIDSSELFHGEVLNYLVLKSDLDDGGPDLSRLKSGKNLVISGFTGTAPPFTDGETFTNQGASQAYIRMDTPTGGTIEIDDSLTIEGESSPYQATVQHIFTPGQIRNVDIAGTLGREFGENLTVTVQRGSAVNNGKWKVSSSHFDDATDISSVRIRHLSNPGFPFVAQAKGVDTIALFQDQPTHRANQVARISFQLGEPDQEPDALLVEFEAEAVGGADQVYSCQGRTMMWLEDLDVTDFGNRPPSFEALLSVRPGSGLGDEIGQLCQDKGLSSAEFDVSGVTGVLGGYADRGPQPGKRTLQPLMIAKNLVARDEAGIMVFQDRDAIPFTDLDADLGELGVTPEGGDAPQPVRIKDEPELGLPREINVQYIDPENEYRQGSKRARLSRAGTGAVSTIQLPIVMSGDEAQQTVDRFLALAHATRLGFAGTFVPRLIPNVREGTGVTLKNVHGRDWPVLVTQVERGANFLPMFEGLYEDSEVLVQEGTGEGSLSESVTGGGGGVTTPAPDVFWHVLDIPALRDEDSERAGRYIVAANADQNIDARGFVVYESTDGGTSFHQIGQISRPGTFGSLVTAPSSAGIEFRVPDRATTYRVRLFTQGGKPSSVDLQETAKGHNRWLIGDEIIGASSVVLVSTDALTGERTYDLSVLFRGLADTDDAMTHVVGERVVWLDGPGVHFLPLNVAAIDHERHLRIVAHGGNPDEALAASSTITGRNVMPYRVVQIAGVRDGAGNLTILWQRQSRAIVQFLDQSEPVGEPVERYRVDILDAPAGNVLRTFTPRTNSQFYPAASQTADGITPFDPVDVRIRQTSKRLHWGRAREETI